MGQLKLIELNSVDQLRAHAEPWDDLWSRSDVAWPTTRAELLAQWMEQFAPQSQFQSLIVARGDVWLAALPLYSKPLARFLNVGSLPGNEWGPAGDLLFDRSNSSEAVLNLLARGLSQSSWPLVWCDAVALETPRWQLLLAALERARVKTNSNVRGQIGLVSIGDDWDAYLAAARRNHRRHMRVVSKKAEAGGELRLVEIDAASADELDSLVYQGFAVEDCNWKGRDGTSVFRTPGMFDHFLRQAQQLREWGQLKLVLLTLDGQPIAFEYGWLAKQTYFAVKVGYDERFSAYSPGQLLRRRAFEQWHTDRTVKLVDFAGPLVEATAKWTTAAYPVSRLAIAPRRVGSELLLAGLCRLRPALKKLVGRKRVVTATSAAEDVAAEAVDAVAAK